MTKLPVALTQRPPSKSHRIRIVGMEGAAERLLKSSSVAEFCASWDALTSEEARGLLGRRPLLLSNVLVREIPQDDSIWLARANLFDKPERKLEELSKATECCQSPKLYAAIAGLYFVNGQLDLGRGVFDTAFKLRWRRKEAGFLWLSWAGLDKSQSKAILTKGIETCADGLLWNNYIKQCLSSEVYDIFLKARERRTLTLRAISYIIQALDSEKARIRVYEQSLYSFPSILELELWKMYLRSFPSVDLFESAIRKYSNETQLWLLYAATRSSTTECLRILKKAIWSVRPEKRSGILRQMLALSPFESVFTESLDALNDSDANIFAQDLALLEEEAGKPEEARLVYRYACVFNDPLTAAGGVFWARWSEFEERNGTMETRSQLEAERSAVALTIGSDPMRRVDREKEIQFVTEFM